MKTPKLNPALLDKLAYTVKLADATTRLKKAEEKARAAAAELGGQAGEKMAAAVDQLTQFKPIDERGEIQIPAELLSQLEAQNAAPPATERTNVLAELAKSGMNAADIIRTVEKAPNVSAFALDIASRSAWPPNDVQVWLDYLDSISYDYVGLGVQNCIALLPQIVATAKFVTEMNLEKTTEARNALISAALVKKTSDALNRLRTPGNRRQRRSAKAAR